MPTRRIPISASPVDSRGESSIVGSAAGKSVRSPKTTEAEFTRQVIQLAKIQSWKICHFRPAVNRSGKWSTPLQGDPGWPDLFAVHEAKRLAFAAELKVGDNEPTPEQRQWLEAMRRAGIRTFLWTPADWPTIEAVLRGEDVSPPTPAERDEDEGERLRALFSAQ
jgi:hypothetical protein